MSDLVELCQKAGCYKRATILVVLDGSDGTLEFHACQHHARAFQRWAEEQTEIQHGWIVAYSSWENAESKELRDKW